MTTTNANGENTFFGLPPGDYTVVETNPPGYPDKNVKDEDTTPIQLDFPLTYKTISYRRQNEELPIYVASN